MKKTSNLLLILLAILIAIIAYFILQQQITTLRHNHYLELSKQMNGQVERMVDLKSKSVLGIALALSKDKSIHQTLKSKAIISSLKEESLNLSLLLRKYTKYKNVWIQIIDKEGVSRSRSWTKKHGDSILAARLDVREMLDRPRIMENISVGKFTMSFKSMVPVYENEALIGIVELITHFNSIILGLEKENIQSMVMVDKRYRDQLTKTISKTFINDYYVANFTVNDELIALFNSVSIPSLLKSKSYIIVDDHFITHTEIKDIEGNNMGYYFQIRPVDNINSQEATSLIYSITLVVVIIIMVILFFFYILVINKKKIEKQKDFFHAVMDSSNDGIVVTDFCTLIDINDAFIRYFSLSDSRNLKKIDFEWLSNKINEELSAAKKDPSESWEDFFLHFHNTDVDLTFNINKKHTIFSVHLTSLRETEHLYILRFIDVTKQKAQNKQLEYIAHFDALTGLPNRVLLADRLAQAMKYTQRLDQRLAVVFLDLDGFKDVNDSYGHEVGDKLLIALSENMKNLLREGDTIARLGGDEFVAVLVDVNNEEDCTLLLNRLLAANAQPIKVDGHILKISVSIGSTFYPQDSDVDADQLLRQADQAMYQAKLSGKNRFHFFDLERDINIRSHFESLGRLQSALDNKEFVMFYQPKVNMRTGDIIGVEALIRWQHPEQGIKSPDTFLPILENQKLFLDVESWVFDTVFSQLNDWGEEGLKIPISINISAMQLQQSNFVELLQQKLNVYPQLDHSLIELEVLETSALDDVNRISHIIEECKSIGISFAIDDFGTGYSSLTYLKHLPATQLKIDQSFIQNMLADPNDLAILESIMALASAFGRDVLAEGVESIQHGSLLLHLGCELAQGYQIARPMPAEDLPKWIENWEPVKEWTKIKTIDKDDFATLYESIELHNWVKSINDYINDKTNEAPRLSEGECRFGQWLKTKGKKRYQNNPLFHTIIKLHDQMHIEANQVISLKENNQLSKDLSELDNMNQLQDQLLNYINNLVIPKDH